MVLLYMIVGLRGQGDSLVVVVICLGGWLMHRGFKGVFVSKLMRSGSTFSFKLGSMHTLISIGLMQDVQCLSFDQA